MSRTRLLSRTAVIFLCLSSSRVKGADLGWGSHFVYVFVYFHVFDRKFYNEHSHLTKRNFDSVEIFMSPTEGEGDILFLVRILLASALATVSA